MKILLIQIRKDKMKEHEYECFLKSFNFTKEQLISYDIFEHETISSETLNGYDAVIIGGSGEFCVTNKEFPYLDELKNLITHCYNENFPFMGVCLGTHLAAMFLGGKVIKEDKYKEVGSFLVHTTKAAKDDPLFHNLPDSFYAQLGHLDSVVELPPGAVNLAYTDTCPYDGFTFPDKKFYCLQFHPELTKKGLEERLYYYYNRGYAKKEEIDGIMSGSRDSDEVRQMLDNFKKIMENS